MSKPLGGLPPAWQQLGAAPPVSGRPEFTGNYVPIFIYIWRGEETETSAPCARVNVEVDVRVEPQT
eukprot:2428245-Lingulodinium_polyedra.AAC.1